MDLNNIILPDSVIADLYHNTLIESNESFKNVSDTNDSNKKEPGIMPQKTKDWKWLGENKKNILILINHNKAVYLPDNELHFLTGILTACKLSLADVAILNINNLPDVTYRELTSFFKSRIVLLFAIEPVSLGLPMNFPHYQIQSFANNSFLYAPSLDELENDKILKSKLWVCLKRLFNI